MFYLERLLRAYYWLYLSNRVDQNEIDSRHCELANHLCSIQNLPVKNRVYKKKILSGKRYFFDFSSIFQECFSSPNRNITISIITPRRSIWMWYILRSIKLVYQKPAPVSPGSTVNYRCIINKKMIHKILTRLILSTT